MRYLHYVGFFLLIGIPDQVLAQGFPGDIVPYPVNGQIVTGGYNHYSSPPAGSSLERVHLYEFAQDSSDPNFITDPGFDNLPGFAPLIPGKPLGFHITTDLMYWNGVGSVSFSPAADPAQLTLSLGGQHLDINGSAATGSFSTVQIADVNGRLHTHLGATISLDSPEGIYLIGMTLNMPGLTDSKPVYILYNDFQTLLLSPDPADFATADALGQNAAAWVQEHVDSIPEPSSWLLAATGGMVLVIAALRHRLAAAVARSTACVTP